MTSEIDVHINVGHKSFSIGGKLDYLYRLIPKTLRFYKMISVGKKELATPPGFSKIVPNQTLAFSPEGSTKRIGKARTAYLSIYIEKSG